MAVRGLLGPGEDCRSETWGCELWKIPKSPWSMFMWLWVKEGGDLLATFPAPVSWEEVWQGPQGLNS